MRFRILISRKILFFPALLASLSGCETYSTPDGQIPDALVADALRYQGNYSGKTHVTSTDSNLHPGSYRPNLSGSFRLNGRTPEITVDQDFAGAGCGSKIGALKSIQDNIAFFEFDPGACADRIHGRELLAYAQGSTGSERILLIVEKRLVRSMSTRPGAPHAVRYELRGEFKKK